MLKDPFSASPSSLLAERTTERDRLRAEVARLTAELAELRAQEPVAIRYETANGVYRYRKFVKSFASEYAILKPINLYARPIPAAQAVPEWMPKLYSWLARARFENAGDEATAALYGNHLRELIAPRPNGQQKGGV